MVKRCCVKGCNGNYDYNNKETVFRLPSKKKEPEERQIWLNNIPRDNIPDHKDTVVCNRHFPPNFETIVIHGRERPRYPPSIFSCVKPSLVPTPAPKQRHTKIAFSSSRNVLPDELDAFRKMDSIQSFDDLKKEILEGKRKFVVSVIPYCYDDGLIIQSSEFEEGSCIPRFLLKIFIDLTYNAFHCGVLCTIKSLSSCRISSLDSWSKIEEAISFLNRMEKSVKKDVIIQQISAMGSLVHIGDKKYKPEMIIRAFEYFATSRSLYNRLRQDFELPDVTTLTRLTSKVDNFSDIDFLRNVFDAIENKQRSCIMLIDEVYVKPALMYHGGSIFGKAVNKPNELANTVLSFFNVSGFGGPKFLYRMLPVYKLDTSFLREQADNIIRSINEVGGNIMAIVCDNNRVNQSFFKSFNCVRPWLTTSGIFLLFVFVHILKSIRNNWITEKTQELEFYDGFTLRVARWSDIVNLYNLEESSLVKMAKLTEVSVFPKPIERQTVSTCLKIFNEKTVAALKENPEIKDADGTIIFLEKIIKFRKIMNVKGKHENERFRDPDRSPILSLNEPSLAYLLEIAEMADKMKAPGNKRYKQLTNDTGSALSHTCRGVVEMSKYLLSNTHDYVLLGQFTTEPLEKMFGKLRQGSGGTYFISVKQVLEKLSIQKTKLLLKLDVDVGLINVESGHSCESCNYLMDDDAINIFDNLPELEKSLSVDVKSTLVYISGYIIRKDFPANVTNADDTYEYYDKFSGYTKELNRGGLVIPYDAMCQFVFFAYILFHEIMNKVCKKSLCNALMVISDCYTLNVDRKHGTILSNILLNNYTHVYTQIVQRA